MKSFTTLMEELELTLQYHDQLNPSIWDGDTLRPEIHDKLMEIAEAWRQYANIPARCVKDIIITGGNVNFNYTPFSDVDLHLITDFHDMGEYGLVYDYLMSKKGLWADAHHITINGYNVELYAQPIDEKFHAGQGAYSLKTNEWIQKPTNLHLDFQHDPRLVQHVEEYLDKISKVIQSGDLDSARALKDSIREMRGASITKAGEFAIGNLIFKELRNRGALDQLSTHIKSHEDQALSIAR